MTDHGAKNRPDAELPGAELPGAKLTDAKLPDAKLFCHCGAALAAPSPREADISDSSNIPLAELRLPPELPRYFGSVDYWIRRAAGAPLLDNALFDKRRKELHRYSVADVNGPLTLTLPIVKPHGLRNATWRDVAVSDHGQWWHVHRVTLESAYGRTPFFEFYIDRLLPFLSSTTPSAFPSVIDLNLAIDRVLSEILLLPAPQVATTPGVPSSAEPQTAEPQAADLPLEPYWQPRADRFGFLPSLSVLDLIFCLGPEAALWLRRMAARRYPASTSPS